MKKLFVPQEDITAYELAIIVAKTTVMGIDGILFSHENWEEEVLPLGLSRHFTNKESK